MSSSMSMGTRFKLSAMMFLQFIMFAVFWAALAPYVTNQGEAWASWKPWILSTMALGSLASPLMGMFADRYFNGEKVLAFSNLICAGMLFMAARATSGLEVFIYLLIAMLFYMPTWGLTASIAMANSPADQFPQIRVFGTIGWVSSMVFSIVALQVFNVKIDGTNIPFYCGAASAVVAALIALMCPATPPKGQKLPLKDILGSIGWIIAIMLINVAVGYFFYGYYNSIWFGIVRLIVGIGPLFCIPRCVIDVFGLRAFSMLKDKNFAVFIFVTLVAMIPFNIHFAFLGDFLSSKGFQQVTAVTYIGQAAEVFCMLLVTWAMRKFGVKWSIVAGLAALTIRYAAYYFAAGDMTSLVYIGILIHGVIFGFFVVGGQVYVGKTASADMQGQAQGFYALMAFGIGSFIGTFVNNGMINHFTAPVKRMVEGKEVTLLEGSWDKVWLVTLVCSLICLVVMTIFFNPKREESK